MSEASARIRKPIFIIAGPRSGGAMLFDLLANGTVLSLIRDGGEVIGRLTGTDDRSPRLVASNATAEIIEAVHEAFYQRLHHNEHRVLDASWQNVFRVPFLAQVFPDAAFLFMHREPRGAIASLVADGAAPDAAMRHWLESVSILVDGLQQVPPEKVHVILFEQFVEQPAQELARLGKFLDLAFHGQLGKISAPEDEQATAAVEPLLQWAEPLARRARELANREQKPPATPAAPADGAQAFQCSATPEFAEILRELRSSLVVTTYQSGRVILVRQRDGVLNMHLRIMPRPMGVAVTADRIAVGIDREIVELRNQRELAASIEPANSHDALFLPRLSRMTGDIAVHELAWVRGELWAVNTRFSALCTFDDEHNFVPRWRPPFISALAPDDRCHLNGFAVDGDRIRYVTALGATDGTDAWRKNKSSGGVIVDVESGAIVAQGLSMPHSPRLHLGSLWILESGRGTLARVDPKTGRVETIAELPGFTRGLAFAGPFAFVGLSQVRESNMFGGIPLVDRVKERVCGVCVVDIRNGEVLARMKFDGIVHEIFDVQLLHGIAFPELLERSDPRLSVSFAIPAEALPVT